jgi:hypothetical protein
MVAFSNKVELQRMQKVFRIFQPLKPSGYDTYHQVLTFKNSTLCPYGANRKGLCLLRSRNWIIIYTSGKALCHDRRLVAGLRGQRPRFDPKSIHVVDKITLGQVFLRLSEYFGIPPVQHTYFEVALIWEPSKSNALSFIGKYWIESHFEFAFRLLT